MTVKTRDQSFECKFLILNSPNARFTESIGYPMANANFLSISHRIEIWLIFHNIDVAQHSLNKFKNVPK
jgi:hypothetical protein